jgi:dCMP deaminase
MLTRRWDRHFLRLALEHSRMSKDPRTKVGALIVSPDRGIISAGFNGFPQRITDSAERLNDRNIKLDLIIHAEMNAILFAARRGIATKGNAMYIIGHSALTGDILGLPPCVRCAVQMIQAGITQVITCPLNTSLQHWEDSCLTAQRIMHEAGVEYIEIPADALTEK